MVSEGGDDVNGWDGWGLAGSRESRQEGTKMRKMSRWATVAQLVAGRQKLRHDIFDHSAFCCISLRHYYESYELTTR